MSCSPSFLQQFITGLQYVLAVEDGNSADLQVLVNRLASISSMRREYGLDETCWHTVHCVRDTNPLTYTSPLHGGRGIATAADLATLWREHLHQGLDVPTTGTRGHPIGQRALYAFASVPRLAAQVRLIITPGDPGWESTAYVDNLAADLRILQPLWDIPADLLDTDAARLQLVVKASDDDMPDARMTAFDIARAAGLSRTRSYQVLEDPRLTTIEPLNHPDKPGTGLPAAQTDHDPQFLREAPPRQFGIHTSGALFSITTRTDPGHTIADTTTDLPYNWDQLHRAAIRAGFAA